MTGIHFSKEVAENHVRTKPLARRRESGGVAKEIRQD
jgi:hypothetical protein